MSAIRFVLRWTLLAAIVVFLVLVTQVARAFLDHGFQGGLHLESEPAGARVFVDGVEQDSPTPSLVRVDADWIPTASSAALRVEMEGEVATAIAARMPERTVGTHAWNHGRGELWPELNGALWVARRGSYRVWFPRAGRALCAVGLFHYRSREFHLDGELLPPHAFGPRTSRNFDTTLGLDLADGEHELKASMWRAVLNLQDHTALYLDEADSTGRDHEHERFVLALPPDQFPVQTLSHDDGSRHTLQGAGPHAFRASHALLELEDARGRAHSIELWLERGAGLWIRAGIAP